MLLSHPALQQLRKRLGRFAYGLAASPSEAAAHNGQEPQTPCLSATWQRPACTGNTQRGHRQRACEGNDMTGFDQVQRGAIDRRTGDAASTSPGKRAREGEQLAAGPKRGMRAQRAGDISAA